MSQQNDCKACRENVRITNEEIERIFGKTLKIKDVKLVTQEVYALRMKHCNECDALQYGTTCRFCGCLVQIKAKLVGAKCPFPYDPRW